MNITTQSRREAHHKALESLASNGQPGLKLWRKLRGLEAQAHYEAIAYCNGNRTSEAFKAYQIKVEKRVLEILGKVPAGFFVNGDPRGYALKIDNESFIPEGMHKDWGGYGILAAEIEEN